MTIKELIDLANKYIDDGASVHLNETIDHSLVLRVFKGSQWTGGEWEKVAETGDGTFFAGTPSRKYKCNRKFVINEDNSIGLTPCVGECIAEIRKGEFVDYTKICNLRG